MGEGNSVSAYTLDGLTGVLAAMTGSPFSVAPCDPQHGGSITPVAIDTSGRFAVVGNPNAPMIGSGSNSTQPDNLDVYFSDPAAGSLTPVSGSPFTTGAFFPV
jgi:hypothetical protein